MGPWAWMVAYPSDFNFISLGYMLHVVMIHYLHIYIKLYLHTYLCTYSHVTLLMYVKTRYSFKQRKKFLNNTFAWDRTTCWVLGFSSLKALQMAAVGLTYLRPSAFLVFSCCSRASSIALGWHRGDVRRLALGLRPPRHQQQQPA